MRPRLEDIFNRAEGRLLFSCFSSSIHRIQQFLELCQEFKRKAAIVGRSMTTVSEIAHPNGSGAVPVIELDRISEGGSSHR